MSKAGIIAGKAVIVVDIRDMVTKSLKGIQNKLRQFSRNVSRMSLNMTLFGGAATAGQWYLTKQFTEFEDSLLFLQTKLKTTRREFEALTERIRELGRSTSFTAQEVVEAAVFLGQAGFESEEIDNMLQAVLDLARGTRTELPTAARILANSLRTFDIDSKNANKVVSQFLIGVDNGTLDLVALSEAMKEVQGTFRGLNVPLETSIGLITALSSRSLRGTKAGTSLNAMILNLASNQKKIKQVFGVDIADEQGNLRNVLDVLEEIMKASENMGNVKKTDLFRRLFNIRGGRTIEPLFSQMKDGLRVLINEIRDAENQARDAALTMDSKWGGSMRRATTALQDLNLTINEVLTKALKPFTDAIPGLTNAVDLLARKNKNLTLAIALAPPAILAMGLGFLFASTVASKLALVIGGLNSGLLGMSRLVLSLAGAPLNILAQGFAAATIAGGKFDLMMGALIPDLYKKGQKKGQTRPTSFISKISNTALKLPKVTLVGPYEFLLKVFTRIQAIRFPKTVALITMVISRATDDLSKFWGMFSKTPIGKFLVLVKKLNVQIAYLVTNMTLALNTGGLSSLFGTSFRGFRVADPFLNILNTVRQLGREIPRVGRHIRIIYKLEMRDREDRAKRRAEQIKVETARRIETAAATKHLRMRQKQLSAARRGSLLRGLSVMGTASSVDSKDAARLSATLTSMQRKVLKFSSTLKQIRGINFLVSVNKELITLRSLLGRGILSFKPLINIFNLVKTSFSGLFSGARGFGFFATIGKTAKSAFSVFQVAFSGLWNVIRRIDIVKILYNMITGFKTFLTTIFAVGRGILRFALSWNALFLAIDIIILFGDKIPVIAESLTNFKNAFTGAFAQLAKIGDLVGPAFARIREGINGLKNGQEDAFDIISEGVKNVVEIIQSQLWNAWATFVNAIKDEVAFVYRTFMSVYQIIVRIVEVIGSLVSNLTSLPGATEGLGQKIRDQIGPIAKDIIFGIGDMIEGLTLAVLDVYQTAYKGLSSMMGMLMTGVRGLLDIFLRIVDALPQFAGSKSVMSAGKAALTGLTVAEIGRQKDILKMEENVEKARDSVKKGTDKFKGKIEEIFDKDFELELVIPKKLIVDVLDYGIDDIKDRSFPDTDEWMKELANLAKGTATAFSFAKEKFMDATVGSFGATRNALLRTETKEDKIVNLLGDIAENTGNMADAL